MWDRGAGSRSIGRFVSGAWRRGALLFHFCPERNEARVQFRRWGIFSPVARADDEIDARQLVLVQSEGLADDPADTVTFDTTACSTNRDGETETWPTLVVPERSHTKESVAKPTTASVRRIKVRLATQAPLRGESKPCWGRAIAGQGRIVLLARACNYGRHAPRHKDAYATGEDAAAARRPVPAVARPSVRPEVHGAQPDRVAAHNERRGFCHALWNELSTALGATACQYGAAILRSHTCTEPVRARPPHFARLIGALHSMDSVAGPLVSKRAARLSR
jgi:hypothetical protein